MLDKYYRVNVVKQFKVRLFHIYLLLSVRSCRTVHGSIVIGWQCICISIPQQRISLYSIGTVLTKMSGTIISFTYRGEQAAMCQKVRDYD